MAQLETGPGEAAERAQIRRRWAGIATLFCLGLPVGFFAARFEEGDRGGVLTGTLPPWFAVIAAVVSLIAIVGGSIAMYRRIDELERRDNMAAGVMGANALLALYPPWFFLWKGGLAPEPTHQALFLLVFATSLVTYLILKLRNR